MIQPFDYTKLNWKERKELREAYVIEQKGLCFYCGCRLDRRPPKNILDKEIDWRLFPPNFREHPIHLQHNHYTKMTEGAVHSYCNAVMWQYEGK
jgi:hypothetical protein